MEISVSTGAAGFVKGIIGKSRPMLLSPRIYVLAVTAQSADGSESDLNACTTTVIVH